MTPKEKILQYVVYYEPLVEGGYEVFVPNYPEIVTYGRTLAEARQMAKDALRCHLEGLSRCNNLVKFTKIKSTRRETISIVLNPA